MQFSFWHLLMLLTIVLIFFGPSRLPGLGNSLGKAIRGFKEGIKGLNDDEENDERDAQAAREALPPSKAKTAKKKTNKKTSQS